VHDSLHQGHLRQVQLWIAQGYTHLAHLASSTECMCCQPEQTIDVGYSADEPTAASQHAQIAITVCVVRVSTRYAAAAHTTPALALCVQLAVVALDSSEAQMIKVDTQQVLGASFPLTSPPLTLPKRARILSFPVHTFAKSIINAVQGTGSTKSM
jgi:hypothetical protein